MSDPCACGQPWFGHEAESTSVQPPVADPFRPQGSALAVPPPLATSAPPDLLSASLPSPVTTFGRSTLSTLATANDNRNSAIASHFPKPKYRPPRAFPSNTTPPPPPFQVLIGFWPNVIGPSFHEPPGAPTLDFAYTIDEFTEMLMKIKKHGLVFPATLRDGPSIIQDLDAEVLAHLAQCYLALPTGTTQVTAVDSVVPWFRLQWMLLQPSRRKTVYVFSQHPTANANNFCRKMILELNSKFPNPDTEHSNLPLIVLAPRFGHVSGSLTCNLSPNALIDAAHLESLHSCFGQRILHGLPYSGRHRDLQCHPASCPDDDQPLVSAPAQIPRRRERTPAAMVASSSASQVRSHSPLLNLSPPRNRRRVDPPPVIEVLSSDDEDLLPPVPLLPLRRTNPPRASTSTNTHTGTPPRTSSALLRLATGSQISDWQQRIWLDVGTVPEAHEVRIDGVNITGMAQYILDIFIHLRSKQSDSSSSSTFPRPPSIRRPRTTMTHMSFLQHEMHRSYSVGPRIGSSVGRGVERSVWRCLLPLVAQDDQFWQPSTVDAGYFTFLLSPVSTLDRTNRFYVYGQLIALHLYYLGHGLSIGLWPVLAIALGRKSTLLGQKFLALVSPDIAEELNPWFQLRPEDPIPSGATHPVRSLIMELLNTQPFMVPSVRTLAQHDNWTSEVVSHKLFGCAPWDKPQFIAMSSGFDMLISDRLTFGHHFRTLNPLDAALLIAGMYRREIQSLADDVMPHLHFSVTAPSPQVDLMKSLFEMRFKRYLAGRGHPPWFRQQGLVDSDVEMERASELPFLRAQFLLVTALESSYLPIKDNWSIQFTVSSALQPALSGNTQEAPPLQFHTCGGSVDVRVNRKLLELMMKSPPGNQDTEFDVWAHTQLYNADLAYNNL
ncbi:hypothetical protein DFH07DRAFT_949834 [Mycena maculata]|uniref:Uncharacterized protein n=1 Tax=Mycena maculata TaxID=230809 RepID=A0AAD7KAN1_9AGAR|nr:hypothetical protein DFH07DRAFT_949834 [Mycena maculata]